MQVEDEEVDEDDEYSDDDDMSWKVRRSAAKCIEAMISYQPEALADNITNLGPLLLGRFKEREENVRYDIFQAYSALLKQTANILPLVQTQHQVQYHPHQPTQGSRTPDALTATAFIYPTNIGSVGASPLQTATFSLAAFQKFVREELTAEQRRVFERLEQQVPQLVRALYGHLRGRNLKNKQQCFILLAGLLKALPGSLAGHMRVIVQPLQGMLGDKAADGNMKVSGWGFEI